MELRKPINVVLFAGLNTIWLYIFSLANLNFSDAFDYNVFFRFLDVKIILLLLFTGIFLALAIAFAVYVFRTVDKKTYVLSVVAGGSISAVIAFLISHSAIAVFLFGFYVLGCVLMAFGEKKEMGGLFEKLGIGWNSAKKVTLVFAIGAFIGTAIFTYAGKEEYKEMAMESFLNFTTNMLSGNVLGGMDLSQIVSRQDVADLICGQVSRESIRGLLIAQLGNQWNLLNASQQNDLIEISYQQSMTKCRNESYIDAAYLTMQERLENIGNTTIGNQTTPLVEKIIRQIPIIKTLFDFIPIFTALLIFSGVTLFASIFVDPFCALFALALPGKKQEAKVVKLSEEK
jgi:hypothetical protein